MDPKEFSRLRMMADVLEGFNINKYNIFSRGEVARLLICRMCKKSPASELPLTKLASCCAGHFCCDNCAKVQTRFGCTRLANSDKTCRQKIIFVEISILANFLMYPERFSITVPEDISVTLQDAFPPPNSSTVKKNVQPKLNGNKEPDPYFGISFVVNRDPSTATGSASEVLEPSGALVLRNPSAVTESASEVLKPRRPRVLWNPPEVTESASEVLKSRRPLVLRNPPAVTESASEVLKPRRPRVLWNPSPHVEKDKHIAASLTGLVANEETDCKKNGRIEKVETTIEKSECNNETCDYARCEHDHCQDETYDQIGLWHHMMKTHHTNCSVGEEQRFNLRLSNNTNNQQYPSKSVLLAVEAFGEKFILFREERERSFILFGIILNDLQIAKNFNFAVNVLRANDDTQSLTSWTWGVFPFGSKIIKEDYKNLVQIKKMAIRIHKNTLRDAISMSKGVTQKRSFECCPIKLSILNLSK